MNDLISRSALMEYPLQRGKIMCHEARENQHFLNGVASVLEYAQNLPSVPTEVVRHGRWKTLYLNSHICSECNMESEDRNRYCAYCGARMDADRGSAHQKELNEKNEYNCRGFTEAERVIFNDALESVYGMTECSMDGQGEGDAE